MINPIFANAFNEEAFTEFILELIPSISLNQKRAETRAGFKSIQQIAEVDESSLDLVVFIAKPESSLNARVEITKNTYAVLKSHARSNALVVYVSDDSPEWRLSLITTKVNRTKEGIKESISNPRRFSYVLGPGAKVITPSKMIQGKIVSIQDLESQFSLAVVSKEFYTRIAIQYSKLVGGTRGEGKKAVQFERLLELGNTDDSVNANFAIRLIGRLVFCWFLKQKKGQLNTSLIPADLLSVEAVKKIADYYHSVCAPLFFEVLNKPKNSRPSFFSYSELFDKVPFLNGGLFQDHAEDNHKFNRTNGMSERRGVVKVPDVWFSELFQVFEEYNFTIDENTSIDTELSIDPEMLGRIFENLLAEVNPETGASARKSTGSFYTPREIVDFMVEESLVAHLKIKTKISEEKIRALSSYDLEDDASQPFDLQNRKILVEAIHDTTILDPACGSGAFPIGVLQRMVHMLGVIDPDCEIYLSKLPPEVRRQLQQHNLNYVRKLGIIRGCIHGVDIQPIATDISRLRCFLTLVVDQQVDDNAPNRGIEPLPNLDFKFVCANTLIKPPIHEGPLLGDEFAVALGELIDEYFAPVDQMHKLETARKLQQLISDKTKKELESIVQSFSGVKDENHKRILAERRQVNNDERIRINNLWGSYENIFQNKPVGFFDTRYFFPAVYRQGGFDIVIANPPYVSINELARTKNPLITYLKSGQASLGNYYGVNLHSIPDNVKKYPPKPNFFAFFFVAANAIVKKQGFISFIVPKGILSAKDLDVIRHFFLHKLTINQIVVFKEKVFIHKETGAGTVPTSSLVILLEKEERQDIYDINIANIGLEEITDFKFSHTDSDILRKNIINWNVILFKKEIVGIAEKYKRNVDANIYFEHKNLNKVSKHLFYFDVGFILDDKYKLSEINPIDKLRYYNLFDASGFKKYVVNTTEFYPKDNTKIALTKNSQGYAILEQKYKIVWSVKNPKNFSFSSEDILFPMGQAAIIASNDKEEIFYLWGLLNSKLSRLIFNIYFKNEGEKDFLLPISAIKYFFKVPKLSDNNNIKKINLIDTVKNILAVTNSEDYLENPAKKEEVGEYEKQIDQLVYKLYDLTPKEIKIVEGEN